LERPVAIDLFAGAGGLALGFEQAGFDVVAALEADPAHAAAHRFNFPWCDVVQRDAATVTGTELKAAAARGLESLNRQTRRANRIDVVFGGPPCQGFSVMGHLDPDDPRNALIGHFARLVCEIRPTAFVLENVPAMGSRTLPGFDIPVPRWIAEAMARHGYTTAAPTVMNASCFGVPQDRRRMIIVGVLERLSTPTPPAPTTLARSKRPGLRPRPWEVGHVRAPAGLAIGPSVRDAIGDLPDVDFFDCLLRTDEAPVPSGLRVLARTIASDYAAELAGIGPATEDYSRARRRRPSILSSSMRTTHTDEVVARFADVEPGHVDDISRFYRLHPDGVAPTLRAGSAPERGSYSAPRPIHPTFDRVISVREAARLSGFPDWFRFTAAKWHGFRQVGNAVCPPFGRAVAASLRDALGFEPSRPAGRWALGDPALLWVPSGAGRRARHHMGAGTVGYQRYSRS
jgi:DNA (cytosine-5)-methyltransferase 1